MSPFDPHMLHAPPTYDVRRFLHIRSAGAPVFSPDSSHVTCLMDVTGNFQLWSLPREGGWPEQLTFGHERVTSAWYSPDGRWLAYTTDVGGNERSQIHLLSPDGSRDIDMSRNPAAFHSFGCWSPDSSTIAFASNRRHTAFFDVYIQRLADGVMECVLEGESYFVPVEWTRDGKGLILWEQLGSFSTALYLLDLETRALRRLTPENEMARYHVAQQSVDGLYLYMVTDHGRDFLSIARLELATREIEYLYSVPWDIESLTLSHDGQLAAFLVNEDGCSRLYVHNLLDTHHHFGSAIHIDPLPKGHISSLNFSHDGRFLTFSLSGPSHNPDVWVVDLREGDARRLTRSSRAGIPASYLVEPEVVRYPTFDGREIPALLYLPPGFESRRGELPVIIHMHGGPESQARMAFSPIFQHFLHRGYGVLAPNVRGSIGYGRAYADLDNKRLRLDSVRDLVAAAEWVGSMGIFDSRKVVVMGGSYGGYMTLAALSLFPDYWAAGVDIVGIANLRTFIQNTGPYRRKWRMWEYGDPAEDGEFMDSISPVHHAHRIKAPLMVIHGANDPRVPQNEADQIVAAVQSRGGVVEYLLYPDEGHGILKLPNRIHCYSRVVDFLDRHVKG